jgi:hypothetical protein
MALNTNSSYVAVGQEEPIRRPVRKMADSASLHLGRRMLKYPGPSLFRMAFKAGIDIIIESPSCS